MSSVAASRAIIPAEVLKGVDGEDDGCWCHCHDVCGCGPHDKPELVDHGLMIVERWHNDTHPNGFQFCDQQPCHAINWAAR
jgi:hypothetical protein